MRVLVMGIKLLTISVVCVKLVHGRCLVFTDVDIPVTEGLEVGGPGGQVRSDCDHSVGWSRARLALMTPISSVKNK